LLSGLKAGLLGSQPVNLQYFWHRGKKDDMLSSKLANMLAGKKQAGCGSGID